MTRPTALTWAEVNSVPYRQRLSSGSLVDRFGGLGGMILRPPVHERPGAADLRLGGEL